MRALTGLRRRAFGSPTFRRRRYIGCIAAGALLLGAPAMASSAAAAVDQSFTAGNNLGANLNNCCRYVAQTFTAGVSGELIGVNVDVADLDPRIQPRLRVEIR